MRLGVAAAVVEGDMVPGDLRVENGLVADVGLGRGGTGIAVPGLVDLQVNGYAGIDLLAAEPDGIARLGRALARDGVLWYQPTLISSPPEATREALAAIGRVGTTATGARILGAHLEGPFLSRARPGAHPPEHIHAVSLDLLASFLVAGCRVSMVTLAPELAGADDVVTALAQRGIVASLGHSDATAGVAHAAFDHGAGAVTHLFNAMRPFGHRDPGLVGAALARDDVTVTLIADGAHVAPEALLVARRAASGRFALVSDAVAGAGLGDGEFTLGTVSVTVRDGVARNADGALAGAVRPLAWGLRYLVELGVPIPEAVDAVTRTPARLVGRPEAGRLAPGSPADLVVLGDDFAVDRVLVAGEPVAP